MDSGDVEVDSLFRWSSNMAITSSTASSGAWRLRWLSLILSGLPPRSTTIQDQVNFSNWDTGPAKPCRVQLASGGRRAGDPVGASQGGIVLKSLTSSILAFSGVEYHGFSWVSAEEDSKATTTTTGQGRSVVSQTAWFGGAELFRGVEGKVG